MIHTATIQPFLDLARTLPVLDVRTPAEYAKAHIPGAINLPLFTDEERALVGTAYKREGRDNAVLLGLDIVGPRLRSMVETVRSTVEGRQVLLHCWRGGMRSGSVAWLLDFYGYRVTTLRGGYKAFRRFAVESFAVPHSIVVLGGKTGSGKTAILHALHRAGAQTVDLEAYAHHKGSSFGRLGGTVRPTQEQFENDLAWHLYHTDPALPLWVEDESRSIGWVRIPDAFWAQMRSAPVRFLDIPVEQRIANLIGDYGSYTTAELAECITRLHKPLGGLDTRTALDALEHGDLAGVCRIMLRYYDKTYLYGLSQRDTATVKKIETSLQTPESIANLLLGSLSCP